VFPSTDGRKPFSFRPHWEAAVYAAGIENFRFHDLRHTTASYLAMNGATLIEIADVLGHKTLEMVKRYVHLADSHKAGVLEKMNVAVFGESDG
jgi:integrase